MTKQEEPINKGTKLANLILGGAAFFCAMTLLYFIYFYSWTHERYFTSPVGPILYYILPTTLASLLLISFRLEPSYRINLSLFLVSIGVSIYIVELLLTYVPSMLSRGILDTASIAKELGIAFDTRDPLDVIIDLEKQHINTVPSISPSLLLKERMDNTLQSAITINGKEILPLGGIANKVTVFCNESGEYVMYESDEHGFHNPKGIWDTGDVDIVALGDSFTQGYCVPSHKNFVAFIREHYPATLNLGIRGNGPLAELATLKEYGPPIAPKVVLWFYFEGNDLVDLRREKGSPLLMAYLRDNFTQGLLPLQTEIDQALTTYVTAGRNAHTPKKWGEHEQADGGASRLLEELQAITKLTEVRQHLGLVAGRSSQDSLKG